MTVQNTTVKDIYVGNGATTKFPITFQMTDHPEYIKVYITGDDSVAVETENFSVDLGAKTVTYPANGDPLPDGHKITIYRELPLYQLMNLVNQGPFFAENIELSFDDLTFICQQLNEKLNRTLSAGIDVSNFNNTFPVKAGMSFRINDAGDGLVLTEDPARVLPLAKDVLEQTKQVKESAVNETTNIKNTAIEELTAIKDAAVNETTEIKDEAVAAKNTAVGAAATAAEDAVNNVQTLLDEKVAAAENAKSAAVSSAESALASKNAAAASQSSAAASAETAQASAESASSSANAALASKNAALTSENNAKASETKSAKSEENAKAAETAAENSKKSASDSASAASSSAESALESKTLAAASANSASASKTSAESSAESAASSATTATRQADRAQDIADSLEGLAGITGIATTDEAIAGVVDNKAMTPLKTKEAIEQGTNVFTALNAFRANIIVSNGTAAGSQGQIVLGVKPRTATVQANIISSTTGALNYNATETTGHYFKIGNNIATTSITSNESETAIFSHNAFEFARITNVGVAKWLGNANTATKLETARTINGVAFDGTQDITIEASGGGDVTAAGDNNFTGTNTFNKPITVRDGALAGIGGTIILGTKPNSATTQAKINSTTTGAMYYTATEGLGHFFNVGTAAVATIGGTATTATLDFLANSILKYSTSSGLRVGGGGTSKIIGFYPEAADNTAGMRLSNQAEAISTDYSVFSLQNNHNINYANNAALQVGSFKFLEIDKTTKDLAIMAETGGKITLTANAQGDNTATLDIEGNLSIAQGIIVGSTTNTGIYNGVIRAGNVENCLYLAGTAENTHFAEPNTGDNVNYQAGANCYQINCSVNNPSSFNMNISTMKFKTSFTDEPHMWKTLTIFLSVGATVPAVTWRFPTGSAVYYPKGVAPTLTANANNIINVIAIVDYTGSFTIQVCDTVVLPYSG